MKILVCCPMKEEKDNFVSSFKRFTKSNGSFPHEVKVITTGIGKVNAAVEVTNMMLSLEFDLICVVGYAAATSNFHIGELVIPNRARYSDANLPPEVSVECLQKEYELSGFDDCVIFTSDSFIDKNRATDILSKFNTSSALFDMESAAVCQSVDDYDVDVMVLKIVSDIPQEESTTTFNENVKIYNDFMPIVSYISMLK